jgi:hypothetical protein
VAATMARVFLRCTATLLGSIDLARATLPEARPGP